LSRCLFDDLYQINNCFVMIYDYFFTEDQNKKKHDFKKTFI